MVELRCPCIEALNGVNTAMVYMELKREASESGATRRWVPVLLSLLAVLVVALTQLLPGSPLGHALPDGSPLRPLEREEREAVLFDLQRLSDLSPTLQAASALLTQRLLDEQIVSESSKVSADESIEVDVAAARANVPLIRRERRSLIFAVRFFRSDAGAQEAALKQALVELPAWAGLEVAARPVPVGAIPAIGEVDNDSAPAR